MQKDMKIGFFLGLTLVISAVIWLATRPNLSPEARIQQLHNMDSRRQSDEKPFVPAIVKSPEPDSIVEQIENLPPPPAEIPGDDTETGIENEINDLPDSTIYEQAEKIEAQKYHIVLKGETLSAISYKYYGSASKWRNILDSNPDIIKDANKIKPGMKLIIPN